MWTAILHIHQKDVTPRVTLLRRNAINASIDFCATQSCFVHHSCGLRFYTLTLNHVTPRVTLLRRNAINASIDFSATQSCFVHH